MKDSIEILSVEDDPLQAEWIRQTIEDRVAGTRVQQISTESEFVAKLSEIIANPPALILMDVMLRWADPSPNIPERPADVKNGGMQRAGLRCQVRLAADPATYGIPVILYTVLQNGELNQLKASALMPAHVVHIQKDSDPSDLLREIRRLIRAGN
jgi:CheY-like chemotaxis protein